MVKYCRLYPNYSSLLLAEYIFRLWGVLNKCLKCRMHKIHQKKVIKFIRSKKAYERYQVDLVEISKELNSINLLIYKLVLAISQSMLGLFQLKIKRQ